MGTASNNRLFYVSAPLTGPTTGGTITVAYNDASSSTPVSFADGASTVVVIDNLNWAVTTGNGLAGGTYNLDVQGTGFGIIGSTADLRLTLASSVVGVAGTNAGTTADPQINRTGLTVANLSNTFFAGSVNAVNSPLPITLISFTAIVVNGEVKLVWETSSELNNAYFTIQRSKDGANWNNIQQVPGAGTSSGNMSYTAYDPAPYMGASFYRLLQTDFDGNNSYSSVCAVNIQNASPTISIFPNPAANVLVVTFPATEKYEVRLFNSAGHLVNNSVGGTGGSVTLNVSTLAAGIYIVSIFYDNHTESREIMIWK